MAETTSRGRNMNQTSLYSKPEVLCRIPINKGTLTYDHSYMGPQSGSWPSPILFIPHVGLAAADDSVTRSSFKLYFFNEQGSPVASNDLISSLHLDKLMEFSPFALNYSKGIYTLMAAKSCRNDIWYNYITATFSSKGELSEVKTIPDDFQQHEGNFLLDGKIISIDKTAKGRMTWREYDNGKSEMLFDDVLATRNSVMSPYD
jgi:hypothetical protein